VEASGVLERQEDREVVSLGPAKRAAFDASGNATKAAAGFARSRGIAVDALETVATEKGEYVAARVLEKGETAAALLEARLPALILALRFPKVMRWEPSGAAFTRPLRWILALLGEAPLRFRVADVESGRATRGHRFLAPGPIEVRSPVEYEGALRRAHVVVDAGERRGAIEAALGAAARAAGGRLVSDEELLDQVAFLVETPGVLAGSFDARYLNLLPDIVKTAMKQHQRYFCVEDAEGRLLPRFLSVVNVPADDAARLAIVRAGNERVLAARLEDAEFYWEEDQKTPLRAKVPLLDRVVWQERLGTVGEKARRIERLALHLAEKESPQTRDVVKKAAPLLKADLVTEMIQDGKEFTKLQGLIGREYANRSGEPTEVAEAIYEHYLPRFAGDDLPLTSTGAVLSVADKIDTIVGCFGVGLVPTGSQDPFALRRLARGVLRIFRGSDSQWELEVIVKAAIEEYKGKLAAEPARLTADVIAFFDDRLKNLLAEGGLTYDAVDAALAVTRRPKEVEERARAIDAFRGSPDFERLAIGYKRVANILKGTEKTAAVDAKRFAEAPEGALHEALVRASAAITKPLAERRYRDVMETLLGLRGVIDTFFDKVLVMAEDPRLRANRLALLGEVRDLFLRFADLSRIVIEGESR
jgi:glycyl-tRNA synthetase beta chain